jgi:hypothetical protein
MGPASVRWLMRVLGECMTIRHTGAVLAFGLALAVPASAAPGQCSFTGYDSFDCTVELDGGGLAFALPDGDTFVFAATGDGQGNGYRIPAGTGPGRPPVELGRFDSLGDEPGCWQSPQADIKFCVLVEE